MHGPTDDRAYRLIPAGAGKTLLAAVNGSSLTAHPRGGGENGAIIYIPLDCSGSSPRGRGKP